MEVYYVSLLRSMLESQLLAGLVAALGISFGGIRAKLGDADANCPYGAGRAARWLRPAWSAQPGRVGGGRQGAGHDGR